MAMTMSKFHSELGKRIKALTARGIPEGHWGDYLEIKAAHAAVNVHARGVKAEEAARVLREIHTRLEMIEVG